MKHMTLICFVCLLGVCSLSRPGPAQAQVSVNGSCSAYQLEPPFLTRSAPPLVMLVMGRNHKLYYEAYNDASDLDGDGDLDIGYDPSIDYYGYFDSYKYYAYDSSNKRFNPMGETSNKQCPSGANNYWSGDFLNYLSMSRMDTLRKVLYGGYRSTDTSSETVLERAYIPQDAHSWGKEYAGVAHDGYDIRDYTPLDLPEGNTRHLFANTSHHDFADSNYAPLLRVLENSIYRIWEWVAIERPVAGSKALDGASGPAVTDNTGKGDLETMADLTGGGDGGSASDKAVAEGGGESTLSSDFDSGVPAVLQWVDHDEDNHTDYWQSGSELVIDAGGRDVWTSYDEFACLYLDDVNGSLDMKLKITQQEEQDGWGKTGIMIRNDMTQAGSSSGYCMMAVTPDNGYAMQWDSNDNGYLNGNDNSGSVSLPAWVRLTKEGTTFTGYYGDDGENWTEHKSITLSSAQSSQDIGIFVTSHKNNKLSECKFDEATITYGGGGEPAPDLAFDDADGTSWTHPDEPGSGSSSVWIQFQFDSAVEVLSYTINADADAPEDWDLKGSNDGSVWYSVDSRSSAGLTPGSAESFACSTSDSYVYYRLDITDSALEADGVSIAEIEFFELVEAVPETATLTDYEVRVKVCDASVGIEDGAKEYPDGNYKPVGLLQRHGESDRMYFGLLTGSYAKNTSGGVLRKAVSSITDEIDADTGEFTYLDDSSVQGIIKTIDRFRIIDFSYGSYAYDTDCGWITTSALDEGECRMWGNPIGEMMYETLRYFSGAGSPTAAFDYNSGDSGLDDNELGLPKAVWDDPYDASTGYDYCSKPIMLVLSDINPTYDSDQLPGSYFGFMSAETLGGADAALNVDALADTIADAEGKTGDAFFIGQEGSEYDGACTAKTLSSGFGQIRGLCPEEPTKEGSYYSAAVAHYGQVQDMHATAQGEQNVNTYCVGLASPLPKIEISVGNGTITLVPFAKSISGSGISSAEGDFQPTNTIVDFFVESVTETSGRFRINYEDVEQGADHDMDAVVEYEYQVVDASGDPVSNATLGEQVEVTLTSSYADGSIVQHLGYIISGTTTDGIYLDVRDADTGAGSDPDYFLDTPNTGDALPLTQTRIFTPGETSAATLLEDPLWYAAKWGGFRDNNENAIPDLDNEWDDDQDGVPDTYFYVQNPLELESKINLAFSDILSRVSAGSAASVVTATRSGEGALYQAVFWPRKYDEIGNEALWAGDVHAYLLSMDGQLYEDSNGNQGRDSNDQEVNLYYSDSDGRTMACIGGEVVNGSCAGSTVDLEEIKYLWSAAEWLNSGSLAPAYNRYPYISSSHQRFLFTWVDNDLDGRVDDTLIDNTGEVLQFTPTALNATNATQWCSAEVVNWIRGQDQSGMRSRKLVENGVDTYARLGDIIHSTPVVCGRPAENYDLYWGDSSYTEFLKAYSNRRIVLYFGGNDGMLHAVNGGFYSGADDTFYRSYNPATGVYGNSGPALGAELWGYIPYNLQPHLACLTRSDYEHQYYVDSKPRIFDVKIFNDDSTHPNGWGTILVCGMRFGGGHVQANGRDFMSSYMIFDVTDPEQEPVLLGEVTYDASDNSLVQLGYTLSIPSVVPALSQTGQQKWFLIFGSGPDADSIASTDAASSQKAKLAVIPLNELIQNNVSLKIPDSAPSRTSPGRIEISVNNSYISTPFVAVDYDFDFKTDILYYGLISGSGAPWGGGVYRLKVEAKNNPANWDDPSKWGIHELLDADAPVTGEPNIGWSDQQVWVYFGTGRFLTSDDKTDSSQQYFFGIKEPKQTNSNAYNFSTMTINYTNVNTNKWVKASDILVTNSGGLECAGGGSGCYPDTGVDTFSALEDYTVEEASSGWFRELASSERVVGQSTLLGGIVNYTAYTPSSDLCEAEGESNLYAVYYLTGTPWKEDVFGDADDDNDNYVDYSKPLGKGLGPTPTIHMGPKGPPEVIVQTSPGNIVPEKQPNLPIQNYQSGRTGWHMHDLED